VLCVAYHLWFSFISGAGLRRVEASSAQKNLFDRGKIARVQFSEMICEGNDAISGIQQNRNCLLAVSFLAGTVSLLAQKILAILLDDGQLKQVCKDGVRSLFATAHLPSPHARVRSIAAAVVEQHGTFRVQRVESEGDQEED
jgi:hypothetical protein